MFFQLLDLAAQGWLADEAALGCLAKMAGFGHGNDVLQVPDIHAIFKQVK
jgi:hypothetical protein